MITPINHPLIHSKITLEQTKIQKTPSLKNMIIMTMTILQKRVQKIHTHLVQSTIPRSRKEPNSLHITTVMRINTVRKKKKVSKKLTDKTKFKSKNMIHLSLKSVEWAVAGCLIRRVLLNMKKTAKKFFKKKGNSSIHSSIELIQTNKNNS